MSVTLIQGGDGMKTEQAQFEQLYADLNEAFAKGDVDFILSHAAEDIRWEMVGDSVVEGKEEVAKRLEAVKGIVSEEFTTKRIIASGRTAAIEGTMLCPDETGTIRKAAFCDLYTLNEKGKITDLTAYFIFL
ncbi:hypothetical protein CHH78_12435 [Shouchella clausii]|jgi:ketosteroid isomerase-like protein|uniref:SnoaL-like domain-containing protein n=2 Tax=Shouchella clausii TaxID=79880 RepID=A0A268S423_SHOCL|nr:hypothetical protein BC8716_10305 [Shouchella clausii]PAD43330.1 hypothetical protein CHH54_07205 [Bacillus sp. 7520-S]PAD08923.1 hypothetical protein CHH76_12295 [Shouchella clausii]PAD15315.1 hypothetical protein CHH74_06945 [Shouchella clausii]PAD93989.1 hypothetical protein CHH52_01070 [Shouchella clausii]